MKKTVPLFDAAATVRGGTVVMVNGLMGVGSSHRLIDELVPQGTRAERMRACVL